MIEQSITYIKNLIKDPKVASVSPTSANVIAKMLKGVDFESIKVLVEYGPGDGVITRELLKRLNPDAKLIAIELNEPFVRELGKIDDQRLTVVHGSAEDVRSILSEQGVHDVDLVISGIPFSLVRYRTRVKILSATRVVIKTEGSLLVYQASIQLKSLLQKYFKDVSVQYAWKNIPPLFIFRATGRHHRPSRRQDRKAR